MKKKNGRINVKDGCINEKDYLHAVNVWNKFKIKSKFLIR